MTTNHPTPVELSDEALAEIEAREPETPYALGQPYVPLTPDERDALCATVRALRAEVDRGALCEECDEWEYNEDNSCRTFTVCGACWNKLQQTNAALCEQLAERERELSEAAREIAVAGPIAHRIRVLKQTYEERAAEAKAAYKSRLAQVEQERDDLRTCDACERPATDRTCRLHGRRL